MRATISNSFILFLLNNFGVYTDFQISAGKKMKFHKRKVYRNFNHILNVLLHYPVICTVNNMFHAIPNDQQTVIQFIDILQHTTGRHAIDDATHNVCHQTVVGVV